MIQTLENSSSAREQKRQALATLVGVKPNPTPYVLNCTYHGVAIKFYFESESLLSEMKSFLPSNWQNSKSFSETLEAGNHSYDLNKNKLLPSGIYFVKITVDGTQVIKKFVIE